TEAGDIASQEPLRIFAAFSAETLRTNYLKIQEQVPRCTMLPMIKANAYGHGAVWAARVLRDMPGLQGFGVATLEEGRELRAGLGASGSRIPIHVFSGVGPWTDEKGQFC